MAAQAGGHRAVRRAAGSAPASAVADGTGATSCRAVPEAAHEEALTRPDMTASVHYIRFPLTPIRWSDSPAGPVVLAVDHPDYRTRRPSATRPAELLTDLDREAITPATSLSGTR